jgi:hypothetical protein
MQRGDSLTYISDIKNVISIKDLLDFAIGIAKGNKGNRN